MFSNPHWINEFRQEVHVSMNKVISNWLKVETPSVILKIFDSFKFEVKKKSIGHFGVEFEFHDKDKSFEIKRKGRFPKKLTLIHLKKEINILLITLSSSPRPLSS